jgi:hypothetical protein
MAGVESSGLKRAPETNKQRVHDGRMRCVANGMRACGRACVGGISWVGRRERRRGKSVDGEAGLCGVGGDLVSVELE